jgi:hypothetical protein
MISSQLDRAPGLSGMRAGNIGLFTGKPKGAKIRLVNGLEHDEF